MGNCFSSKKEVAQDPTSLNVGAKQSQEPVHLQSVQQPLTNPKVDSSSEGSPSGLVSASSIESAKILADKATQVVPLTEHEGAEKPPQIKAVSEDAPSVATTELKLAAEPSSETQRARDDARDDAAGYGAAGASTTASTDLTNVLGAATGFEADGPSHATISNLEEGRVVGVSVGGDAAAATDSLSTDVKDAPGFGAGGA